MKLSLHYLSDSGAPAETVMIGIVNERKLRNINAAGQALIEAAKTLPILRFQHSLLYA